MIANKQLNTAGVVQALRDFLREWFSHASVFRISESMAECETMPKAEYVRCETGGKFGYRSDFCIPEGESMDLGGVLQLARMIRDDWEDRRG